MLGYPSYETLWHSGVSVGKKGQRSHTNCGGSALVLCCCSGFGITVKGSARIGLYLVLVPSNGLSYIIIVLNREFGDACPDCQCLKHQEFLLT